MKKDKLKNYEVHYVADSDEAAFNIDNVVSHPDLNGIFWKMISKSINARSKNSDVKKRIVLAKNIVRPIVQNLVDDAFNLLRELNADEWNSSNEQQDDDKWILNFLGKLERDLESGTLKKLQNINGESSENKVYANGRLLFKLTAIHGQLGTIIEKLRKKCVGSDADTVKTHIGTSKSVNDVSNSSKTHTTTNKEDLGSVLGLNNSDREEIKPPHCKHCKNEQNLVNRNEFANIFYLKNSQSASHLDSVQQLFSPRRSKSESLISKKELFKSFDPHNSKRIVINCLTDLEKVRRYLEALAKQKKNARMPKYSGLEKCLNSKCAEPFPHLHTSSTDSPMVFKLNMEPAENERKYDLIIGIPGSSSNDRDVNIFLNRHQRSRKKLPPQLYNNEYFKPIKFKTKSSKTPEKRLLQLANYTSHLDEINLTTKQNEITVKMKSNEHLNEKNANLIFFDPEDPSKSVVKMRDSKKSNEVVSKAEGTFNLSFFINSKVIINHKIFLIFAISNLLNTYFNFFLVVLIMTKRWNDRRKQLEEIINLKPKPIQSNIYNVYIFSWLKSLNNVNKEGENEETEQEYVWKGPMPKKSKYYELPKFKPDVKKKKKKKNKEVKKECSKEQEKKEVLPVLNEAGDVVAQKVSIVNVSKEDGPKRVSFSDEVNQQFNCSKKQEEENKDMFLMGLDIISNKVENSISDTIRIVETSDGRLLSRFYDDKGRPIGDVYNSSGNLLAKVDPNEVDYLATVLFDRRGELIKYHYDEKGNKIRQLFDANGLPVQQIMIPKELKRQDYYNRQGKPIDKLYDWHGYAIKPEPADDIPNFVSDEDNNLVGGLYDPKGNEIEDVYDEDRKLLAKVKPKLEVESKQLVTFDEPRVDQSEDSIHHFFNRKGEPILRICNSKGKTLIETPNGEAEDLLPFLFDLNGRFIPGRYNSRGKKILEVFDRNGQVISEISISALDDSTTQSVLRIHSSTTKNDCNTLPMMDKNFKELNKVYNNHSELITSIFDSKGHCLVENSSGGALELIPHLFDLQGYFIKKRYDSSGRKLSKVRDERGKTIKKAYVKNGKVFYLPSKSGDSIHQFFTSKDCLIKGVYDKQGNEIKSCDSGGADKLAPFLFDDQGVLFDNLYDSKGERIRRVYDERGRAVTTVSIHDWDGETSNASKKIDRRIVQTSRDEPRRRGSGPGSARPRGEPRSRGYR